MSVRRRFPAIPGDLGEGTVRKLKEIAEIWAGDRGDKLDRVVTFRDLSDSKLGRITRSGELAPGSAFDLGPGSAFDGGDLVHLKPLTDLEVSGAVYNMILTWKGTDQLGFAYVEIWRSEDNNLGNAILVGTSRGGTYADPVGPGAYRCYWVRAISTTGTPTAFNQTDGTCGETAPDVDRLLELLEEKLTKSQLVSDLRETIELIDDPETGLVQSVEQLASTVGEPAPSDNLLHDGDLAKVDGGCSPGWYWCTTSSKPSSLRTRSHGYAIRITPTSFTGTGFRMNLAKNEDGTTLIRAEGGEAFRIRGWYYLESASGVRDQTGPAVLALRQFAGSTDKGALRAFGMETTAGVWHRIDAVLRVKTGELIDSVRFEPRSYVDDGAVYFDDMEMYRVAGDEAFGTSILERLAQVEPGRASYSVKTDVNGRVTGYGFAAGPDSSKFAVVSDAFLIASPDADDHGEAPFYHLTTGEYINGEWVPPGTYMRQAFIADGTITRAKIGHAAIDTLRVADGAINEFKLGDGSITSAKIKDFLASEVYVPGQSGWIIRRNGDVEFNDGVFRGLVEIQHAQIGTLEIDGNAVTVPAIAESESQVGVEKIFDRGDPQSSWAWQEALTLVEVFDGAVVPDFVLITATMNWLAQNTGGTGVHMRVRHPDSGWVSPSSGKTTSDSTSMSIQAGCPTAVSGSNTFILEIAQTKQGADFVMGSRSLVAMGAKR